MQSFVDFQYAELCPKMRRWRQITFPRDPTSLEELGGMLNLGGEHETWGKTVDGSQPLFRETVGTHALVFLSEDLKS